MKFENYADYDPTGMGLAGPALLTVWAGIQRFSDELVLVGGLVPHFICKHPEANQRLPRPGTLDVDIGIALCVAVWALQTWRSGEWRLPRVPFEWPLIAFGAAALVSTVWSWVSHEPLRGGLA